MDEIKWAEFPYVRIALCFGIGVMIGEYFAPAISYTYLALAILCFYYLGLESFDRAVILRTHISFAFVFLFILVLAGILRISLENRLISHKNASFDSQKTYIVSGKITEEMKSSFGYKYVLAAQYIKDSNLTSEVKQTVIISFKPQDSTALYKLGDQVVIKAKPRLISSPINPSGFDYSYFLRTKGIVTQFAVAPGYHRKLEINEGTTLMDLPVSYRVDATRILKKFILEPQSKAVAESLLTGSRTNLSNQTAAVFANTGAMHVLAVSGLHVAIFIGLFVFLFGLVSSKRPWFNYMKLVLLLMIITFYVLFTGASPSVVRAGIMISLVLISKMLFKKSNSYNVLSLTALCMLIYQPFMLFQPSFQFSFLALISILYFQPYFARLWHPTHTITKYFWSLTTVTLAAQILIFPLSVYYFHQFPLVFLLSSFVAIPLAAFIIYLGTAIIIIEPYFSDLASLIAKVLNPVLDYLIAILTWLGSSDYALLSNIYFTKFSMVFMLLSIVCLMIWLINRNYLIFIIGLASILLLVGDYSYHKVKSKSQEVFTVYDQYRGFTIDLFSPSVNTCYHTSVLDTANIDFMTSVHRLNYFVNNINYKNIDSLSLLQLGRRKIYLLSNNKDYIRINNKQVVDALIVNTSLKPEKISDLFLKIDPKVIILPRGLYPKTRDNWLKALMDFNFKIHDIAKSGAYIEVEPVISQ